MRTRTTRLAQMRVTKDGFRDLARRCAGLGPRLAVVLEGGYNLETLPDLVEAALDGFSRRGEQAWPLPTRGLEALERLAPGRHAQLAEQALHVRADGVLGDEQALRDLVRPQVLVEQQQDLDLAGGEYARDLLRDAVEPAALANAVEQPAGDTAGERGLAADDAPEERRDLLGRLGLQEVAGAPARIAARRFSSASEAVSTTTSLFGASSRMPGSAVRPSIPGMVRSRRTRSGWSRSAALMASSPFDASPTTSKPCCARSAARASRVRGWSSTSRIRSAMLPLSAGSGLPTRETWTHSRSQSYRSWLVGEVALVGLLASATGLFAISDVLQSSYELPETRLVLDTAVAVVAAIVAVLASVRFLVDGRVLDLLVAAGFWSIALGTIVFGIVPVLGGGPLPPSAAWALVGARLLGAALIAVAPWTDGQLKSRRPALVAVGIGIAAMLASAGMGLSTPPWESKEAGVEIVEGSSVVFAATLLAILWFIALIGFALRYRRYGRDLDSWLCLSVTLALFADLHLVLTPVVSSEYVLQGDFLRLIAYGLLLVGVWRTIADAEFGRAVADERARVAREIHDGLAQYLFAISAQVTMLETGAPLEQVLPRLKRASTAAQQEARFAVLALSSAGGSARFDSALRRYVDVLTADGELDVELDVDRSVRLAPDEQIEVFRIVQEGLGNARRHAGASTWRSRSRSRTAAGSSSCATTASASTKRPPSRARGSRT